MLLIGVLLGSFFGMALLGIPIAMSLVLAAFVTGLFAGIPPIVVIQNMIVGVDSYTLLAVPLFMLAGEIMDKGGLTERMVAFARSLVGHIRGGLGHVTIVAEMILSGVSGSATADAAALGSLLIPAMKKEGYSKEMAAAVTAAASTMGPIIPPSIMMVVYGAYGGVSIVGLFLGGLIPGVLAGLTMMLVVYIWAGREGLSSFPRATLSQIWSNLKETCWALLTPIIIIGGILSGLFTATESAMIAVIYAILVTRLVYHSLTWKETIDALRTTLVAFASPLACVAGAGAFGYILAYLRVPDLILELAHPIVGQPIPILFFLTILFLILGTFMDAIPAIVIFLPIVQKLSATANLNPVYVGTLVTVVLCVGLLTPPYGLTLLLSSGIAEASVSGVLRKLAPFFVVLLVVILVMIVIPETVMFLPRLLVPMAAGN